MKKISVLLFGALSCCLMAHGAEPDPFKEKALKRYAEFASAPIAWTEAEAGPDAQVFGDYLGEESGKKYGAQIKPLGLGTFRLTIFPGGLPGDGWTPPVLGGIPDRPVGIWCEQFGYLRDGVIHFRIKPLDSRIGLLPADWIWKKGQVTVYPTEKKSKETLVLNRANAEADVKDPSGTYRDPAGKWSSPNGVGTGLGSPPFKLEMHVMPWGTGYRAVVAGAGKPPESYAEPGKEWGEVLYGERTGDTVVFDLGKDGLRATWTKDGLAIRDGEQIIARLKKTTRNNKNVGLKPPEGAIVLFDGSNMDGWGHSPFVHKNTEIQAMISQSFKTQRLLAPGVISKQSIPDGRVHYEFMMARAAPPGYVYHVLGETLQTHPTRVLAYCLMPNHWHFVLWPQHEGELTAFAQWLTHTHTMR